MEIVRKALIIFATFVLNDINVEVKKLGIGGFFIPPLVCVLSISSIGLASTTSESRTKMAVTSKSRTVFNV